VQLWPAFKILPKKPVCRWSFTKQYFYLSSHGYYCFLRVVKLLCNIAQHVVKQKLLEIWGKPNLSLPSALSPIRSEN